MNSATRNVSFLVLAVGLGGVLGGCAGAPSPSEESVGDVNAALSTSVCPAGVPATLAPPAGQTLKFSLTGIGVQIYVCEQSPAGAIAWTFLAPQANLLNDDNRLTGTHFIGPTWQGNDGSSVVGAKVAAFTADPSAIPWLLLTAASHAPDGGRFADVTSIQRLSTVGGLAPTAGCDTAHLGAIAQVPYSAEYVFYKAKPQGKVNVCGAI